MHTQRLDWWQHEHVFGQDQVRAGERRTLLVVLLTAAMMVVEIAAGLAFGSMALLADGLHMASHATALGISVFAYVYARRFAGHPRYSFGTGKINALAGFGSAVLLVIFAATMAWESVDRLISPIPIALNQALVVATAGLVVNGASALILAVPGHHGHGHHGHRHDHNLRAAYLHVLADALTSLLAIGALLAARFVDAVWLDPAMGVVGAVLVTRWSLGLLRETGRVLLDVQLPGGATERLRKAIEAQDDNRVADLHLWSIGPGIQAAAIVVVSDQPQSPDHYRRLIPSDLHVVHATVEVHRCRHSARGGERS
ncbi:MAG: CDF family Co(II)/Ni(II) efflux transporter DmeF [Geminicoccaceae bacterium]